MRSPANTGKSDTDTTTESTTTTKPAVAAAMVDALEDILKWERASERALRIAVAASPGSDLADATSDASRN